MRSNAIKAFTLIELLIVVAIIGILAAVAIPNMLQAQTRAKVARMSMEQATLGNALEYYAVDHNVYPPAPYAIPPFGNPASETQIWRLTTPESYISEIPIDIFYQFPNYPPLNSLPGGAFGPAGQYMHYIADPIVTEHWLLWSYGPDQDMEFLQVDYDPTNGTISDGDIYLVGVRR